jgi:hypothetical protein
MARWRVDILRSRPEHLGAPNILALETDSDKEAVANAEPERLTSAAPLKLRSASNPTARKPVPTND